MGESATELTKFIRKPIIALEKQKDEIGKIYAFVSKTYYEISNLVIKFYRKNYFPAKKREREREK